MGWLATAYYWLSLPDYLAPFFRLGGSATTEHSSIGTKATCFLKSSPITVKKQHDCDYQFALSQVDTAV